MAMKRAEAVSGTTAKRDGPVSREQLYRVVNERAYRIYLKRRNGPGTPLDDWLKAEREITEEFAARVNTNA
jgi:hypothetical protein